MASDGTLDLAVIKKTQDSLGKLIKKPVLSEKLLRKPPFRFLHDIMKSIIKERKYFDGLYTKAELDSENIKDRDSKMQFLQKIIDVIKLVTNEPVAARTSKIVAGQEPEKTNELLQLIAAVVANNVDCKTAIDTVNSGKQKPKIKTKQSSVEKPSKETAAIKKPEKLVEGSSKPAERTSKMKKDVEKEKKSRNTTENKATVEDKEKKPTKVEKVKKSSKTAGGIEKTKKVSTKPSRIETTKTIEKSGDQPENSKLLDEENIEVSPKANEETIQSKQIDELQKSNIEKESQVLDSIPSVETPEIQKTEEPQHPEKKSAGKRRKSSSASKTAKSKVQNDLVDQEVAEQSTSRVPSSSNLTHSEDVQTTTSVTAEAAEVREDISKLETRRQSTFVKGNSSEKAERPRTSLRPPSVRPASARPGAPRRRDKNVEIILQPNDSVKLGAINVKVESFNAELEDDGENLVIIENAALKDDEMKTKLENEDDTEQQGHLVQQILETQKELVQVDEKTELERDVSTLQRTQSSAKQMDSLRDVIQNLTKSINPLGKLLDFIPEDIDSMQLELSMWKDAYATASSELKKERSNTEQAMEPMKNQLAQVIDAIAEHIANIESSRAAILHNSKRIFNLLTE